MRHLEFHFYCFSKLWGIWISRSKVTLGLPPQCPVLQDMVFLWAISWTKVELSHVQNTQTMDNVWEGSISCSVLEIFSSASPSITICATWWDFQFGISVNHHLYLYCRYVGDYLPCTVMCLSSGLQEKKAHVCRSDFLAWEINSKVLRRNCRSNFHWCRACRTHFSRMPCDALISY